jgi:HAD superfamily hydrolase (TIGR01509 family)
VRSATVVAHASGQGTRQGTRVCLIVPAPLRGQARFSVEEQTRAQQTRGDVTVLNAPPDLEALVFDFDGLIIDSERVEADCIIEIVAEWGHTMSYEDIGHLFGSVDADEQWDELLGAACGRTSAELDERLGAMVASLKDQLPLLPGVRELLDAAHQRGLRVGIGTGNTMSKLERRLGRHGVFERFDAIVTRADVAHGKPAPDIYLEVARRLRVRPGACLVLEDSAIGCEAALAAGMRVVACPSIVTAHCTFPTGVQRVRSLLEVAL